MKLRYIFIPFLAVLLMSHNTYAVTLTEEVQFYEQGTPAYFRVQFSNGGDSGFINQYYTNGSVPQNISTLSIKSSSNQAFSSLTDGRYFTFTIRMRFKGVSDKWNTSGAWSINPNSVNCPVIDVTEGDSQFHDLNNLTYTYETLFVSCKYSGSGGVPTTNFTIASSQYTTDWQMRVLNYSVWGRQNLPGVDDVSAIKDAVNSMKNSLGGKIDDVNDKLDDILDEMGKEEDAANDAVEGSETAGGDSSSDAETATSSLISVIGSFVGAVTTATPTNCRINGDMGNLDVGTIDLCANPVPTFVQIISSLILIAICIPFAIVMFNRFIGLFRSFQG